MMMATVPGHTVDELLLHWSGQNPDIEAFVSLTPSSSSASDFQRRSLTRGQLQELVVKFAARLQEWGVCRGDVVCNALPNCLERVVVDLGIISSGAVALNGQVLRADGQDLLQALRSTKAKAVVVNPDPARGAWSILKQQVSDLDTDITCPALPDLRRVVSCQHSPRSHLDFFSCLRQCQHPPPRPCASPSDLALIWTTSGSTGYSKLVPQTHGNVTHIASQVLYISRLKPGDKFINCAPLGWGGGFPVWFLGCGVTRVFLDMTQGTPQNMAQTVWACVQREKCICLFTSPMYVSAILEQPGLWQGENVWRPHTINVAGQPMKMFVVAAAGKLCQDVVINYGTTECGVIASGRFTDPDTYQDGMTGRAALGVDLRIVNDKLEDVGEGEKGEILARSPALYGQYIDKEEAAQMSFTKDGWFRSDDVGYLMPDGQLVHLGRRTDVISRGAYLLYPGWLEGLLRGKCGVRDVCVVPVPDPVLHQEICACVLPQHNPPPADFHDSLRTFAQSLLLTQPGDAQHMAPRYYVTLEAFPLTPTGKISRKDVAALAVQHLGLSSTTSL